MGANSTRVILVRRGAPAYHLCVPTSLYPPRVAEWTTSGDERVVMGVLVQRASQMGTVAQMRPLGLVALRGSRFGYRFLGLLGKRMFALKITVAVSSAGEDATSVRVLGEDNAGWYLVRTTLGDRHFDRQFRQTCLMFGAPADVAVQRGDAS